MAEPENQSVGPDSFTVALTNQGTKCTLNWPLIAEAISTTVSRNGVVVGNFDGSVVSFVDADVTVDPAVYVVTVTAAAFSAVGVIERE